ncbi:MAG: hypothetical protein V7K92_06245 [Nostoc sp.]
MPQALRLLSATLRDALASLLPRRGTLKAILLYERLRQRLRSVQVRSGQAQYKYPMTPLASPVGDAARTTGETLATQWLPNAQHLKKSKLAQCC